MTWKKLLADNKVTRLPVAKQELEDLRSIVTRSLKDVEAPGLPADARFIMAYDAGRTLSLMIVRAAGYRPRTAGGHYNTFVGLEAADARFAQLSVYFDGCRIKRNASEYDVAGRVTETDAEGLLQTVRQFSVDAESLDQGSPSAAGMGGWWDGVPLELQAGVVRCARADACWLLPD